MIEVKLYDYYKNVVKSLTNQIILVTVSINRRKVLETPPKQFKPKPRLSADWSLKYTINSKECIKCKDFMNCFTTSKCVQFKSIYYFKIPTFQRSTNSLSETDHQLSSESKNDQKSHKKSSFFNDISKRSAREHSSILFETCVPVWL